MAAQSTATPSNADALPTVDRLAATDEEKGDKALPLVSNLGDTILTSFSPRHTLSTSDLPCNYPILPIHANRDHGPATDCLAQTLPHSHMTRPDCTLCDHVTYMT